MTEDIRFTVWVHRHVESMFGPMSHPADRDGLVLTFHDEEHALAACSKLNARLGDPYARYSVERELVVRTS